MRLRRIHITQWGPGCHQVCGLINVQGLTIFTLLDVQAPHSLESFVLKLVQKKDSHKEHDSDIDSHTFSKNVHLLDLCESKKTHILNTCLGQF